MHNVRYDFSSCHVDVPPTLADEIIEWGRAHVTDEDIFVTQADPTFGREDEIHVTILYGMHCEYPDLVRSLLEKTGPIQVTLGKVDIFTNPPKFDVVMIDVYSEDLRHLHETLCDKVRHTSKHTIYNPHVTIAYVKKNRGWPYVGFDRWQGREFFCNYAVFSSKNGSKERISLV
jgi:2'-5' RNA ligase